MIEIGAVLPSMMKGPYTSSHILRWCAAQQNWDKIHYDQDYARNTARLPDTLINGALKQHLLAFYLLDRLGHNAWIRALNFRFVGGDLVGDTLLLSGHVVGVRMEGVQVVVSVELQISNTRSEKATTVGSAEVLLNADDSPVKEDLGHGASEHISTAQDVDEDVPKEFQSRVGEVLEEATSYCPVEKGRLALFADAIMDVPALFYDEEAAEAGPYDAVVAPPLFPIHAIAARPGTRPLGVAPESMGREGASEIGRDLATIFGFDPTGLLNGGNRISIHSLARAGETVRGRSWLSSVRRRCGRQGDMLIFETRNAYETVEGRPLLTERLSVIYRME